MAKDKNVENVTAQEETTVETIDLMEENGGPTVEEEAPRMVTVKIPREKKNQEDVFVRVNHRTYLVKRGVQVLVPWFVAEVLRNQEKMLEVIMDFEEANQDKNT